MSEAVATRTVVVANRMGMHVRPAAAIATLVRKFDAKVTISNGVEEADATAPLQLFTLGGVPGKQFTLYATGPQASEALDALEQFFLRKFDED